MRPLAAYVAACAASLLALPAATQTPASRDSTPVGPVRVARGVAPDTVTVGDRFRVYLQIRPPAGATVEFPPIAATDTLQLTDSVRVVTRPDGAVAAAYPLVAWAAGEPLEAAVAVRLTLASGEKLELRVPLRLPVVRSVLPDTGEVRPQPPKGLLEARAPAPQLPLWWLAAAIAVLLAAWAWWRARRGRGAAPIDPREDALRQLEALRSDRLAAGPADQLYLRLTRVVREYLARVEPAWGEDLTTAELVARLADDRMRGVDVATLRSLLHHADRVKFARVVPAPADVERFWSGVGGWIAANPAPPVERQEAA